MSLSDWIDLSQIVAASLVSIAAIIVSVQHLNLGKKKFRFELYDRRKAIYQKTASILYKISNSNNITLEEIIQYRSETREADFLFEKDVTEQLEKVFRYGLKLDAMNEEMKAPLKHYDDGKSPSEIRLMLKREVLNSTDTILSTFNKYLDLSKV